MKKYYDCNSTPEIQLIAYKISHFLVNPINNLQDSELLKMINNKIMVAASVQNISIIKLIQCAISNSGLVFYVFL